MQLAIDPPSSYNSVAQGYKDDDMIVPLVLKGCNCHFIKVQLHPFNTKETMWSYADINYATKRFVHFISCVIILIYSFIKNPK